MKERLKSYKFWVSLSGAIIIFVKALGEALNFEIDEKVIDSIIMGFCGVLVVLGIVEKPVQTEKTDSETTAPEKPTAKNTIEEKNKKN